MIESAAQVIDDVTKKTELTAGIVENAFEGRIRKLLYLIYFSQEVLSQTGVERS